MKKLTIIIASLTFALLSFNVQAHGYQNNRFGTYIGLGFSNSYSYPSHYSSYYPSRYSSYYPSKSLISGIAFRNRNSIIGLQDRHYNGRSSTNRIYQNGYRNSYRNGFSYSYRNGSNRLSGNNYRSDGHHRYGSSCYESYYDRYGNYTERSLPASACRH